MLTVPFSVEIAPMPLGLRTIHGQITAIIVLALLIVVTAGPMLERWLRSDPLAADIEEVADRMHAMANVLAVATPDEREMLISTAQRSGWNVSLEPRSLSQQFEASAPQESIWNRLMEWLFPPDGFTEPLGGWRTFLDGARVVAVEVDDANMLITPVSAEGVFRGNFLGQWSYYAVALLTLIVLFSAFAIWAIMLPLRRIADAALNADISNDAKVFEERGSVEIIALARALNSMRKRITIMVESRTRMLRGISHDLRTPLTRLRLRVEHLPEMQTRDAMLADIQHLDSLLSQSLDYLRDSHAQEVFERTDIASMLQTIASEFADMGFDIVYRGPNRLITTCKPLAMTRALSNLCDNATKFGTSVTVELHERSGSIAIDVIDDGPGIAPPDQQRALEPFVKIDEARSGTKSGFGLGLSIVSEIMQQHAGKLEFLERQPHGLIVRLTLRKH